MKESFSKKNQTQLKIKLQLQKAVTLALKRIRQLQKAVVEFLAVYQIYFDRISQNIPYLTTVVFKSTSETVNFIPLSFQFTHALHELYKLCVIIKKEHSHASNSKDKDTLEIFQNKIARTSAFTAECWNYCNITHTQSVYVKILFSKVKHLCTIIIQQPLL